MDLTQWMFQITTRKQMTLSIPAFHNKKYTSYK
jgi:hypothetical protein